MLAIIRCLEEWDDELRSVKFEIRTDHKNLEYFMTVKKLTERQIRWFLILFKYDFVINYITGKSNERADALSKREQDVPEAGDDKLEYKMAQLLKPGMLNFELLRSLTPYQQLMLNRLVGRSSGCTRWKGMSKIKG